MGDETASADEAGRGPRPLATGIRSWGRYPRSRQDVVAYRDRAAPLPIDGRDGLKLLAYGNGRSYGDSCLNDGGLLVDCRPLDRIIAFDPQTGILRAEAGLLIGEVIARCLPLGWFVPVTPGTALVTLGGALANDVHGKNHHRAGTFGCHVRAFELVRSDGSRMLCTPGRNAGFFAATIAGMGLTGVVTWIELQLMRVAGPLVEERMERFGRLDDFFARVGEAERRHAYSVAWIDSLASGDALGRGLLISGDHAPAVATNSERRPRIRPRVPFDLPVAVVNRPVLKAFNALYWRRVPSAGRERRVGISPFFHPLDAIGDWNRLYGPRGLLQHQSVLPEGAALDAVREMLMLCQRRAHGSFLTVLKRFGSIASPGIMSFPRPGITLTLDFAIRGASTFALLDALDEITLAAGGRVNPYKDARMSAASFRAFFPEHERLAPFLDPAFSSGFWRRVTGG
ncbi:MAG: FAD-binding oxidoreductase [Hyphomicrobiaceae bacterium]